jgi:two-component system sensor histidine kinase DegS
MPLTFDQELIGVWLLGARDPDDVYPPEILSSLESIAQQTTFAIINHQKTARLRALYQANIHRNEQERASLSRDLHDETLNQIALLQREYSDPQLVESLNQITASLREVIQGLRPEMLSFGLINALEDMADSLNERSTTPPITVNLDGPALPLKGLQEIELHIFRIVQQACENAIHHASASAITIQGTVNAELIDILVSDDGAGIEDASSLNLTVLINQQNYGLASMYERADLIKAAINITSRLGEGTQVQIIWPASSKDNSTSSP